MRKCERAGESKSISHCMITSHPWKRSNLNFRVPITLPTDACHWSALLCFMSVPRSLSAGCWGAPGRQGAGLPAWECDRKLCDASTLCSMSDKWSEGYRAADLAGCKNSGSQITAIDSQCFYKQRVHCIISRLRGCIVAAWKDDGL